MKRLARNGIIIALLNCCLGLVVLKVHEARLAYEPWETDSILLTMPRGEQVDLAILGTSHAYLLSRFEKNLDALDRGLGMRTFNMALPTGGGLRPARYYLEYFFESGATTPRLLYFLDPFVFFSTGTNDAHKFVTSEPFHFMFLKKLVLDGYPPKRIFEYIRSKFTHDWLRQEPEPLTMHEGTVPDDTIDPELVARRIKSLYMEGMEQETFLRYREEFVKILELCRNKNVSVYVVIPPTLLGPEPGAPQMLAWLDTLHSEYNFVLYDMVSVMQDPAHYYNLDHLNTAGVERFVGEFLAPIFDQ